MPATFPAALAFAPGAEEGGFLDNFGKGHISPQLMMAMLHTKVY
jgi:hypothetical protein